MTSTRMLREVRVNGKTLKIDLQHDSPVVRFHMDTQQGEVSIVPAEPGVYSLLLEGRSYQVRVTRGRDHLTVYVNGRPCDVEIIDPRDRASNRNAAGGEGRQTLTAPMPGKVVRVLVAVGDTVQVGQGLVVVEAMKMQNEMKSTKAGTVISLPVDEGATVNAGDVLAVVE